MLVCLALSDWSFVFGTVNVGRWDRKLLTSGIPGVQLSDILGTTTCVGAVTPVAATEGRYYSKEEGALQVLHQLLAGAPPAGVEDGQQSRHEERLGGGQGGREANWDGTPR